MKVAPDRIDEFARGEGPFCVACVYAARNLREAGFAEPGCDEGCALGCRVDDPVCRGMRTSNCSIKSFAP